MANRRPSHDPLHIYPLAGRANPFPQSDAPGVVRIVYHVGHIRLYSVPSEISYILFIGCAFARRTGNLCTTGTGKLQA